MTANDAKGYIMSADTAGTTNTASRTFGDEYLWPDSVACLLHQPIRQPRAVITTFEMTDVSNIVHRMLLMRNPWGLTPALYRLQSVGPEPVHLEMNSGSGAIKPQIKMNNRLKI